MPHSWKTTSDNSILKRNLIYEKLFKHNLSRPDQLGRDDSRIPSKSGQQIQLLEVIMELVAIQIIAVGALIISYLSQEFL